MALRKTGVELVTKNAPGFLRDMNRADKSVMKFQDRIDRMRTTAFGRSRLGDLVPQNLLSRVSNLTSLLGGLGRGVDDMRASVSQVNSLWHVLNTQLGYAGVSGRTVSGVWSNLNQQVDSSTSILAANKNVWSSLDQQLQNNIQATDALGSIWSQLDTTAVGLTSRFNLLAAAGAAVGAAFVSLGVRGAAFPGILEGFDLLARYARTTADTLRTDLARAARGTVTDFELMKTANLALAGTEPELAKALGQGGLAGLLEIARSQARATGQSVQYLYESLVLGVKRTSPRLVDNTGLVIGQTAAYEAFARQAGKAANQLTEVEKQLAILNFTLEKGEVAVQTYGQASLIASERIARITVKFHNALDRLAVAVQPLFNAFLAIGETLTDALLAPLKVITPVVYELSKAIGGPLLSAWERLTNILGQAFEPVARLIHRWILTLIALIRQFGMAWDWLLRQVTNILGPFANILRKYLIEPLTKVLDPTTMFKAAGYAFGALGEGILWAFNNVIAPAILLVVDFIADMLMGQSPPPRGRLSKIDQGGYKAMLAWLKGFLGVSLTPVEEMARRIDGLLGNIGKLTYEQVQARLGQLDQLLEPFIANLEIARAKMERITEPLRAVQDILERKLDRALAKFFRGDITAEAVRQIDRQMEGIEERVARAQEITDEAEIQLALAKSQQALERVLLEIQLRRTKAAEKEKEAKEKAAKEKAGAGEEITLPEIPGLGLPALGEDVLGDFLGIDDDEVRNIWAELQQAFKEGVDLTGFGKQFDQAKGKVGELGEQLARFTKEPQFIAGITAAFRPLTEGPDSVAGLVNTFVDQVEKAWQRLKDVLPVDSAPIEELRIALALLVTPTIIRGVWSLVAGILGLGVSLVGLVISNFVRPLRWIVAVSAAPVVNGIKAIAASIVSMTTATVVKGMSAIGSTFQIMRDVGAAVAGALVSSLAALTLIGLVVVGVANRWEEFKGHVSDLVKDLTSGDLVGALSNIGNIALDIPLGIAEMVANLLGLSDEEFYGRLEALDGILSNIETILRTLASKASEWLSGLFDELKESLLGPFEDIIEDIDHLFFGNSPTLHTIITGIPNAIAGWLVDNGLIRKLNDFLFQPFKDVIDDVWTWLTSTDQENSLASTLTNLPGNIEGWLDQLGSTLTTSLFQPFQDMVDDIWRLIFNPFAEGSLARSLLSLPGKIAEWLGDMAITLGAAVTGPIVGAMNALIGIIEGAINTIIDQINGILGYDLVEKGLGLLGVGGGKIGNITIPRIPGARHGGLFGPGLLQLHSDELVYAANQIGVFPQNLSRAMTGFFETAARYQPQSNVRYVDRPAVRPGGHVRTYDQRTTNNTFNVQGSQSWRLILAQTKAYQP